VSKENLIPALVGLFSVLALSFPRFAFGYKSISDPEMLKKKYPGIEEHMKGIIPIQLILLASTMTSTYFLIPWLHEMTGLLLYVTGAAIYMSRFSKIARAPVLPLQGPVISYVEGERANVFGDIQFICGVIMLVLTVSLDLLGLW